MKYLGIEYYYSRDAEGSAALEGLIVRIQPPRSSIRETTVIIYQFLASVSPIRSFGTIVWAVPFESGANSALSDQLF